MSAHRSSATPHPSFRRVKRSYETIWVHKTAPIWVVHYPEIAAGNGLGAIPEFWQPYRAIGKLKRGHEVWAHNNKRIGTEGAFRTLSAALAAADDFATQQAAA